MAQATLNGILDDDGGEACSCHFEYGDTPAMVDTTPPVAGFRTGDTFSAIILGLVPGTTYFYRAVATNSMGTSFGVVLTFTTLRTLPPPTEIPSPYGVMIGDEFISLLEVPA